MSITLLSGPSHATFNVAVGCCDSNSTSSAAAARQEATRAKATNFFTRRLEDPTRCGI
jgi:hypothetical protein